MASALLIGLLTSSSLSDITDMILGGFSSKQVLEQMEKKEEEWTLAYFWLTLLYKNLQNVLIISIMESQIPILVVINVKEHKLTAVSSSLKNFKLRCGNIFI